jgi:hypothetical protein
MPKIRSFFKRVSAENRKEEDHTAGFLYSCINELVLKGTLTTKEYQQIKICKTQILSIQRRRLERLKITGKSRQVAENERTTLYNLIPEQKRRATQTISKIKMADGTVTAVKEDIMKTFVSHYERLFHATDADKNKQYKLLEEIETWTQLSPEEETELAKSLDKHEVLEAVRASPKGRSPGIDGIPYEFYKEYWDIVGEDMVGVLNEILQRGELSETQKQGIIILIPKALHPSSTKDFRPITLLTTDYKILTKVLANRLKMYLAKLVNIAQKGSVPGRTILDAISTIRDVMKYKNTAKEAGCILSIDFQNAYDVIDHGYLLKVLEHHQLGKGFVNYIRCILRGGTSRIQINGHMSQSFPIHRSVRQGCPLSMILCILAMNPLLHTLQQHGRGFRILNHIETATAYVDDVTIFLDSEQDVVSITRVLNEYRHVSGAHINTIKSKALSIGEWDKSMNIYNINYHAEMKNWEYGSQIT